MPPAIAAGGQPSVKPSSTTLSPLTQHQGGPIPKSINHIPLFHGHNPLLSPFTSPESPTVDNHHGPICEKESETGQCLKYYEGALYYRGGEVLKEPKLYLIFYGANWNTNEETKRYKGALVNTLRGMTTEYGFDETYQRILHQYWDDQTEPKQISNTVTVAGEWTYEGIAAPQNLTEEDVEYEVNAAIETNHWTRGKNAVFLVMQPTGASWNGAFAKETECGFHDVDRWGDIYGLIPNLGDPNFKAGCVESEGTTVQRAETETATHEYMEAVTDPHVKEGEAPGWTNEGGWEIADICDARPEMLNEPLSIWVSAVWGNHEKTCVIQDPPEPGPVAPTVITEGATDITPESAVIHGSVNPNGPATTYYVQYGFTSSYGFSKPYPAASAGYGTSSVPVSIELRGLEDAATYHYRLVASSFAGTSYGADQTVTILPAAAPAVVHEAGHSEYRVFYENGENKLAQETFNGTNWSNYVVGASMAQDATPIVVHEAGSNEYMIFYEGGNGHLWQEIFNGTSWASYDIGVGMAPGARPAVVHEAGHNEYRVFYENGENKLAQETFNGTNWSNYVIGGAMIVAGRFSVVHEANHNEYVIFYDGSKSA